MAAPHACLSTPPMDSPFLLLLILTFSLFSFSLIFFSLFKKLKNTEHEQHDPQSQTSISSLKLSLSNIYEKIQNTHQLNSNTQVPKSVLLELLPSKDSPKWGALFSPVQGCDDSVDFGPHSVEKNEKEIREKKKKKRRAKKKHNSLSNTGDLQLVKGEKEVQEYDELGFKNKEELVCLYPFTSSSSATQRKIKQHYDQLVKSHESKALTLAQVGEFVNCLVDAKNELQHKSECIKRKFTITKALLMKADRSSFDRLRQQINKLELEQKRLEEDAFVYNWLQHQLKLSPAYKKMVEIGTCMELKAKSDEPTEDVDADQNSISFEEFLAREKKDTFWQKYGKPKSCSN